MIKKISPALLFLITFFFGVRMAQAQTQDTTSTVPSASILVIPYMPAMHLSDADVDIAQESELDPGQVREQLRAGLVKALNKKFSEVYDIRLPEQDFVEQDMRDMDRIYHSLSFEKDTIWPVKHPQKDSSLLKKKLFQKSDKKTVKPADKFYMNSVVRDPQLLRELSGQYNNDYFIFLNELDIKTRSEDCINLAMKIYVREFKVHYTILNRSGKQVYGDAAVVELPSNENRVDELSKLVFPSIADYVMGSFKHLQQ